MTSFGVVFYGDLLLDLQQNPYVDDSGKFYKAYALDAERRQYRVTWDVIDFNTENEDETCDWSNYRVEEL